MTLDDWALILCLALLAWPALAEGFANHGQQTEGDRQ